jgi:hypothetical protein
MQSWSPEPEGSTQNWNAPPHWGKSWQNRCSWRITQLLAIALTSLRDLTKVPHLTISIKLEDRRKNTTHKPITWWDHIKASVYMPIPGLNAGGITPELKLRLEFYYSWTRWVFFMFFSTFCSFVLLLWVFIFIFNPVSFFSFYIINFTITIFSFLLSLPSLSFLLLC